MSRMKRLLFVGLMVALTVGIVETMARLTHRLMYGEYIAPTTNTSGTFSEQGAKTEAATDKPRAEPFALHPFLGLVFSDRRHGLNIRPTARRQDDALVIAFLGGSVANDIANYLRSALFTASMFGESAETDGRVAPIFLNFATDSFRQPQQALTVANLLAEGMQIDIVIVLDGLNELEQVNVALAKSLAPGTPYYWWPLVRSASGEELAIRARIRSLDNRREHLLRIGPWWGLMYRSAVFGLIRRFELERIEQARQRHLDRQLALVSNESKGRGRADAALEVDRLRRAEIARDYWHRGALLLASLTKRHGAAYYHFLQPNQYLPDSKPLSAEELATAFRPRGTAWMVREAYPQLAQLGQRLREQGVKFSDLSRIFADVPETLYIDWCCHLNERGNRLLADHILRRVLEDPRFVEQSSKSAGVARAVPLASNVFDIYHMGGYLAYTKSPCTVTDTAAPFFLHVTPVFQNDLPPEATSFDNLDFAFGNFGAIFGDRCTATVPLVGYPMANVRTGQFGNGREIWAVDFQPAPLPRLQ